MMTKEGIVRYLIKVAESCRTEDQLIIATRWSGRMINQHKTLIAFISILMQKRNMQLQDVKLSKRKD